MNLRRILKMLAAFFTGQGVSIVTQLLVPPFFLHRYAHGVEVYGEWIALSAAVTYLGTINYGVQTYANNQATIHYNRGEQQEARAIQASALRLLFLLIAMLAPLLAVLFFLPIARWLHLAFASNRQASLTLSLLVLQILVNMIFSLLSNGFMVVGQAHRGANWNNFLRLAMTLALAALAWHRASFPVLAASQLITTALFTVLVLVDIRITAPFLVPDLSASRPGMMRSIIRPSGHFGLLSLSSFLSWQAPVLLLQKMLGPAAVAIFSLTRTIYSMSRQLLIVLTFSISQEITYFVGQRNWKQLHRLYDLSERVVLMLVPVVSVGVLLSSPVLFTVWLHNRALYVPIICILMGLVSAVMGIKEHKYQFQTSSNQHEQLSTLTILSYSAMLLAAAPLVHSFGVPGFLIAWLATELFQTIFLLQLNVSLFPAEMKVSIAPVVKLAVFLVFAFLPATWLAYRALSESLPVIFGITAAATCLLAVSAYFVFGLSELNGLLQAKLRQRFIG